MKKINKEVIKLIVLLIVILFEGLVMLQIRTHNCRNRGYSKCQSAIECGPCEISEEGYEGTKKCHKYYDDNGEIVTEDLSCSC